MSRHHSPTTWCSQGVVPKSPVKAGGGKAFFGNAGEARHARYDRIGKFVAQILPGRLLLGEFIEHEQIDILRSSRRKG
ncbi:hypothetical protein [Bradyrhizobium sp. 200]|uniref:hypothetical protein n=1 Tax=Bradyrhizobium sp. 200 TaxID=2782665 RepID=UPI00200038F9|nr:hypothetical protein [Bradyrhizobium sp. 200]